MENGYVILIGCRDIRHESSILRKHGFKIILFNSFISIEDLCCVDMAYEQDLNDNQKIVNTVTQLSANNINIRSVLTQNDYRTELAAKLAVLINSKYLSEKTATICRNKISVRNALQGTTLDTVQFSVNTHIKTLLDDVKLFNFPVVAKPENEAGSHHVFICKNLEELWDAVHTINNLKLNFAKQLMFNRTLIESFIVGREFSVESISDESQTKIICITEKFTIDCIEKAHLIPGRVSPAEKIKIEEFIIQLHKILNITNAVTHTEIKIDNGIVQLIEMNGRCGGDRISELIRLTTGLDIFEASLLLSLGYSNEEIISLLNYNPNKNNSAMSIFLFADKDGYVKYNHTEQSIDKFVPDGFYTSKTNCNYNRIGSYIVYSDSLLEPAQRINESDGYVSIN